MLCNEVEYRKRCLITKLIKRKTPILRNTPVIYTDPTPEETERTEAVKTTPVCVQKKYEEMYRIYFLLWRYLAKEGLWNEASEYFEEQKDDEMTFDFSFIL